MPTDKELLRYAVELMRRNFIAHISGDHDGVERTTGLICDLINNYDDANYQEVAQGDYQFPPEFVKHFKKL